MKKASAAPGSVSRETQLEVADKEEHLGVFEEADREGVVGGLLLVAV